MDTLQIAVVDGEGRLEEEVSTGIVPWWSFTKTLIAACVLRLAEDGFVALDAPLAGLPYTPRHLLQHRAGVGNYGGLSEYHEVVARGEEPWSDGEIFARIQPDKLLFTPGTGWAYSNVGYLLLRRLIETACRADLKEALHTLILEPLDLHGSRIAKSPDDMRMTVFEGGQDYHPGWAFHGIVIGPVAEAALALHRLLQGNLLAPESRATLLQRYAIGGPIAGRPWQTTGYGLGLMMGAMQRSDMAQPIDVVGHSASGPGSVGAVYCCLHDGRCRTVAAFLAGSHEGDAEYCALQHLIGSSQVTGAGDIRPSSGLCDGF